MRPAFGTTERPAVLPPTCIAPPGESPPKKAERAAPRAVPGRWVQGQRVALRLLGRSKCPFLRQNPGGRHGPSLHQPMSSPCHAIAVSLMRRRIVLRSSPAFVDSFVTTVSATPLPAGAAASCRTMMMQPLPKPSALAKFSGRLRGKKGKSLLRLLSCSSHAFCVHVGQLAGRKVGSNRVFQRHHGNAFPGVKKALPRHPWSTSPHGRGPTGARSFHQPTAGRGLKTAWCQTSAAPL